MRSKIQRVIDIGHYGPQDNDWTFKNTLSDRELALFDFLPDNVSLNNTVEAAISGDDFAAYPNPCTNAQTYHTPRASGLVALKVVVVNNKLDVLQKRALRMEGSMGLRFDYSDSIPNGSSLRVYYSFSAQNKPNYKAGYGDIKICRRAGNQDVNSCFP